MSQNINSELIQGLKSGDRTVFKRVFDTYYKTLVIASYQILKDENISKDAAQEVFLELWKNRAKLHNKVNLSPYLKRSVMNRSLNILKSRKHHISSGDAPLAYIEANSLQPDQQYEQIEFTEVVHRAIDQMPERCRAIFMLCRMDGMTHKEIAEQLGISTKTIENQMTKGLKIIKNAISKYKSELICLLTIYFHEWGNCIFHLFNMYHHIS